LPQPLLLQFPQLLLLRLQLTQQLFHQQLLP
jgi:hypothetical protein